MEHQRKSQGSDQSVNPGANLSQSQTNKSTRYWIAGIFSFLVFLIALAPASLLNSFMSNNNAMTLQGLKGTLWTGSARNARYHGIDLGEVNWQVSPLSLLLLRLQTQVNSKGTDSHINLTLTISPGSLSSDSVKARIPASWLPRLLPLPLKTDGDLFLRFVNLKMKSGKLTRLKGSIAWQNAVVHSPFGTRSELGDLQITATTEANEILFNITDNGGPMGIQSKIHFTPPDFIKADGTVNKNLPQNLANFFRYFTQVNENGRLEFHYKGKVSGL